MPIKLSAPIFKTFELTEVDKRYANEGEPTRVIIKQATQAQHEQRQQLFATLERRYNDYEPDETTLVQTANIEELKRLETYLTLCESNIMNADGEAMFPSKKDKEGIPYLSMTRSQFDKSWGLLPPDIADEIHDKVTELNVMWGAKGG